MTVYSQHAQRGKVQILATYRGPGGVRSSTVTSVEDGTLAAPIVDALNRVSACATVPVSVWDDRRGRFDDYPTEHLAALTDPDARPGLLTGAHSLWYEQARVLLHRALADLDDAAAAAPPPVRTAIGAEVAAEAHALQDELAEYRDGAEPSPPEKRRAWEFQAPFVAPVPELGVQVRDKLDDLERGLTADELERAVADLRLLLGAYLRCADSEARLLIEDFEITDDPYEDDGYFLTIQAPMPNGKRTGWNVEIGHWVPDDPLGEGDSATGEPLLDCARAEPPSLSELAGLLNRGGRLADWVKTPAGQALPGTAFVVTQRYDG